MSMGRTYKFFGFSISYTILNLPLSISTYNLYFLLPVPFPHSPPYSLLGTALPHFRSCKPPCLRLSERPWDPKPLRRQSLSPWQEHRLCLLYFTLLGSQCMTGYPMMGKIPQGRDDLRQAWSPWGHQGRTWGAIEKGGDRPSPLGFDIA